MFIAAIFAQCSIMRVGTNPAKKDNELFVGNYHRVVIPVYIPNLETDYFKDALKIFSLCLESLILTVHKKTRITIYDNSCCAEVKGYIESKYQENDIIDQIFHSKENVGKINALITAIKGNPEPLITVSDADVLFKNGWQKAVENIFIGFPEAGMVSSTPSSRGLTKATANNWYYGFFKGKMEFQKVLNPDEMHMFDVSLGNKDLMYEDIHLEKYLVIKNPSIGAEAVFGCGHFVATIKREVMDHGPRTPALTKTGVAVGVYLDEPNDRLGFLRLATKENYSFHMGNSVEEWMYVEFSKLFKNESNGIDYTSLVKTKRISKLGRVIGKVILQLILRPRIRVKVFNFLGLNYNKRY